MISSQVKGSDEKARYVLKKVNETEKNMAEFKRAMESYLRNQEKLRGKRLGLALALKGFSESETPNIKQALLTTAEAFVDLEEYRKYMHDRIETKAKEPLKLYKAVCKNLKDDVKLRDIAVSKEQKKQLDLDKVTISDSGNRSKISKSQMGLENATKEVQHVSTAFVDHVERFQMKKTSDIQNILFEMIYSEMEYHTKALEILSNLQSSIFSLDLDSDMNEIREKLRDIKAE